ncbi:hypothetical protein EON81_13725 [bacterium]|nr:MAG: hypothetical protein EON81_13725 [bacterium]
MPRPNTGVPGYTQAEADERFALAGDVYTQAEANGKFDPQGRGIARRLSFSGLPLWNARTSSWVPDVRVYLHQDGSVSHDMTMSTFMAGQDWTGYTRFFVDPVNGSDSNNGSTWALAKQTLRYLVGTSTNKVIITRNGALFDHNDGPRGGGLGAHTVLMTEDLNGAPARITSRMRKTAPPWTWDAALSLWKWAGAPVDSVMGCAMDLTHPDAEGNPYRYDPYGTLAACQAAPYRLFRDVAGTTIYINHPGGSGADVTGIIPHYGVSCLNNNVPYWFRSLNMDWECSGAACYSNNPTAGTTTSDQGFYKNRFLFCGTRLVSGNPATGNSTYCSEPGKTINWRCEALGSSSDGFNYQSGHRSIEIECRGMANGYRAADEHATTNQGSTNHGSHCIRINGEYGRNGGPGIQDVKAGGLESISVNVGCCTYDSLWVRGDSPSDAADVVAGITVYADVASIVLIRHRFARPDGTPSTSAKSIWAAASSTILMDQLPASGKVVTEASAKVFGGLV